jgi:nucleoside-triphosphatase THEP1
MYKLIQDLQEGKRTAEIIEDTPGLSFRIKDIDTLRQTLLLEKQNNRNLLVTYLYGEPGSGKTRSIYEQHPTNEICRITNYRNGRGVTFDEYRRTGCTCV